MAETDTSGSQGNTLDQVATQDTGNANAINSTIAEAGNDLSADQNRGPVQAEKAGEPQPKANDQQASNSQSSQSQRELHLQEVKSGKMSIEEFNRLHMSEPGANDQGEGKAPDAEAVIKRKTEDDARGDAERAKWDGGKDVIDYMFEHWLIDGILDVDKDIRSLMLRAGYRLGKSMKEHQEETKKEQEAIKKSNTYKNAEKLEEIKKERAEAISKEVKEKTSQIENIAKAIDSGKLFDPENKALLDAYTQKAFEGRPDADKEAELGKLKDACEARKANPNDDEARKTVRTAAVDFAAPQIIDMRYDLKCRTAALDRSEAEMIQNMAENPKAYEGKDLKEEFGKKEEENFQALSKATVIEREETKQDYPKYLEEKFQLEIELNAAKEKEARTPRLVTYGDDEMPESVTKQNKINKLESDFGKKHFSKADQLGELAKESSEAAVEIVKSGKFKEVDKSIKLPKNKSYVAYAETLQKTHDETTHELEQRPLRERAAANNKMVADAMKRARAAGLLDSAITDRKIDKMLITQQDKLKDKGTDLSLREVELQERRAKFAARLGEKNPKLFKRYMEMYGKNAKPNEEANTTANEPQTKDTASQVISKRKDMSMGID